MRYAAQVHWKPDPLLYPPYLRARIRRRRGIGSGPRYVPWLKVREVPSRGTSMVSRGVFSGRSHHLLSELEAIYFFLLERRAGTVEIREQWPILDIDRTLELCARFGVRPRMRNGYPEPFTIDFLISEQVDGQLTHRAASVKSPEDARDPETRLRLAVEHAWCQDRGIPWTLVETLRFDKTMLETLRFMRGWFRHQYSPDVAKEDLFLAQFAAHHAPSRLLSEVLARVARSLRQPVSAVEDAFRYCSWSGRIQPSLSHRLALDAPFIMTKDPAHA